MLTILIEKALENALKYHPTLAEKCRTLGEKDILITLLTSPTKCLTLIFSNGEARCYEGKTARKPHLHISATPQAFIAMMLKDDKTGLQLDGDVVLAQFLQQCFSYTDLDWESLLNDKLGKSLSYPIIAAFRKGRETIQILQQHTTTKVSDYLQEDLDCLPLPTEVRAFCNEVDELKMRVDRLEAHCK